MVLTFIKFLLPLIVFNTLASSLDLKVSECSLGNSDSCFEAAYEYSKNGDQVNPILYFEKACELKDGKSCFALFKILRKLGQLKDDNTILEKSCNLLK